MLPRGGESARATIIGRIKDAHGRPIGERDPNPIHDTRYYDVQFLDGSVESYATNMIAENLYAQVDQEGNAFNTFKAIVGHRSDKTAVKRTDASFLDGTSRHTKKGWKLQCELSDQSTVWLPLKDVKNGNMVEAAEYAVSAGIAKEPAFAWWVPRPLRKGDRIIKKVRSRYWKIRHSTRVTHKLKASVEKMTTTSRRVQVDRGNNARQKAMSDRNPAYKD